MRAAGAEQRLMPVRQRAGRWVSSQIGAQPPNLARTRVATPNVLAFAVQHNDVPRSQLITVIAILRCRRRSEVIEVRPRAHDVKFVVTRCRPRSCLPATPRLVVTRTRPAPGNHEFHVVGARPYFD